MDSMHSNPAGGAASPFRRPPRPTASRPSHPAAAASAPFTAAFGPVPAQPLTASARRAIAPAAPAPASPAEAGPAPLERQRRNGALWFYWIAGLSVVNSLASLSGQHGASSWGSASPSSPTRSPSRWGRGHRGGGGGGRGDRRRLRAARPLRAAGPGLGLRGGRGDLRARRSHLRGPARLDRGRLPRLRAGDDRRGASTPPAAWPDRPRARSGRAESYCRRAGGLRAGAAFTSGSRMRARRASSARPWMRATISPRLLTTTV